MGHVSVMCHVISTVTCYALTFELRLPETCHCTIFENSFSNVGYFMAEVEAS